MNVNRRSLQNTRMSRSPRGDKELQEIQGRIHRSDVIARSPRAQIGNKNFENVEHYQA